MLEKPIAVLHNDFFPMTPEPTYDLLERGMAVLAILTAELEEREPGAIDKIILEWKANK